MTHDRRQFLFRTAAGLGAGALTAPGILPKRAGALPPGLPFVDYRPVETPDGTTLPFKIVGGVKVFHLVVEPVRHEFAPGLQGNCWGYNGRVHGPTIEAVEGDRVRIYVTNELDAPTTVHWHGLFLPNGMDGVGGLTQRSIEPGETFRYEFELRQHGTYMYHSHHDEMVQMAMGMMGMIVIHPRNPTGPLPDRDFVYMLSEWALKVGTERPDPNEMKDFNVLTFNGKVYPATAPMVVRTGERVRIRLGNLSAMDHHPIHIHGHAFTVVATDGGEVPPGARWPETTVVVATGQTRTIEFVADAPGDWAMHCHMTHHVMTQMGHDIPNLLGVDASRFDEKLAAAVPSYLDMGKSSTDPHAPDETLPKNSQPMVGGQAGFGYVTMGGMVTVLKVRDGIADYADPGHYVHPPGTVAEVASSEDLRRDGIRQ
ncbi:MAG TPA: copper oxidase [Planctomycetota bacterium]|nr:copper oxidase [Planctomycetota bacterium]